MEIDFISVLITVFSLVLFIVPGFLLAKIGILKEGADKALTGLVINVSQPLLMFMSLQKYFDKAILTNVIVVFFATIVIHFIMIGLICLVIRNKDKRAKLNVVKFASVFGNVGFMGIPFLQNLFKNNPEVQSEILIYCAIVIAAFNLMCFSVGVLLASGDKKNVSFKKAFLNPTSISVYVGLFLFLVVGKPIATLGGEGTTLNLFLSKIMSSLQMLGDMVTPLSMIVIGIKLASVTPRKLFLDKWAYVTCLNKLIIMPLITILIVGFLPVNQVLKYAVFFTLAMPSAAITTMFAVQYDTDGEFASSAVLLTTAMSILTIPIMFLVINGVFGI